MSPNHRRAKAYVENYGCSHNQAEGFMIQGFLQQQSYDTTNPNEADVIVVNTCAVKTCTENKMIDRIRQLHRQRKNNQTRLLVTGCLPAVSAQKIQAIAPDIDLPGLSLESFAQTLSLPTEAYCPDQVQQNPNPVIAIVPISVGCLSKCTFCATQMARGVLKSYPQEKILAAIQNGLAQGKKEFWLTSTDCGCYGFDQHTNLAQLVQKILYEIPGDYRLRLGMANPQHLKFFFDELLDVFTDERVYRFLHIPLQSGSNRVLKAMLRHYTAEKFLEMVNAARKRYPDMTLATDVIAGFPTETEEDFHETLRILEQTNLDVINVSKFGLRPGTAANQYTQLSPHVINDRSRLLSAHARDMIAKRHAHMKGTETTVLVSEVGRQGNAVGRTHNYKPIPVNAPLGSFVRVQVNDSHPTFLTGKTLTVF